jgi:regulation of enolase protein 1 (concanavalin A-like superfamily)
MQDLLTWLNPPANSRRSGGDLSVITDDHTDFWRKTENGFIRDNGHFAYRTVAGDFSVEATFTAKYRTLYDQAGLMIRLGAERWIKTGIEFVDELMNFSTVVTNDTSDWSLIPLSKDLDDEAVRVRLVRKGSTVSTALWRPEGHWQTGRVAGFPNELSCQVGVMCCSPQRAGFEVRFSDFVLTSGPRETSAGGLQRCD